MGMGFMLPPWASSATHTRNPYVHYGGRVKSMEKHNEILIGSAINGAADHQKYHMPQNLPRPIDSQTRHRPLTRLLNAQPSVHAHDLSYHR